MDFDCSWYSPCPICKKCMNVADTLYEKCRECGFARQKCRHGDKERNLMIKRRNFRLKISDGALAEIENLGEKSNDING